jgi:prophage antirepressor-like protein
MIVITTQEDWLSAQEVCDILGCNRPGLAVMVERGAIRKRNTEVVSLRRYWRTDIERLAAPPETVSS